MCLPENPGNKEAVKQHSFITGIEGNVTIKSNKQCKIIALLYDDVTIKTFIKILLFNARDHGRLAGTKQRKFTENRSKTSINPRRELE